MTRTVDNQLLIIDRNYFPSYVALAQANIRSIEESAYVRRLLFAITETPDNTPKINDLRQRIANASKASEERLAAARQQINEPQRIFELLGQKSEVTPERLALRDAYVEALDAYRRQALGEGVRRFRGLPRHCLRAIRRANCSWNASLSSASPPLVSIGAASGRWQKSDRTPAPSNFGKLLLGSHS
jgi:hypothetical protein